MAGMCPQVLTAVQLCHCCSQLLPFLPNTIWLATWQHLMTGIELVVSVINNFRPKSFFFYSLFIQKSWGVEPGNEAMEANAVCVKVNVVSCPGLMHRTSRSHAQILMCAD